MPKADGPDEEDLVIYYTDRTTATTDDRCGMRRWWYKHEAGTGIVPVEEALALTVGKQTHEDLAAIAELEDISPNTIGDLIGDLLKSLPPDPTQKQLELAYRRVGWLAAYALYIEPLVRRDYETISVEAEHILDRTPLWIGYTPDRYLRHRAGGYLVYREYKSTITAGAKWLASWPFAVQIHIGLAGMEEELGEKVAFGQVMGLMKGDYREGRLAHPHVWAYRNSNTGEWTYDYNKARAAVWDHAPVWEYPGGVVEWVQRCGEAVAKQQFPHTAPIFYNERILNDWIYRRTFREAQIAEVADDCRTDWQKRILYFEPRNEQCRPAFGDACPYLIACHNAAVRENPLGCSDFTRRTPHHEVEVQYLKGVFDGKVIG
jgi:hypothetical protein